MSLKSRLSLLRGFAQSHSRNPRTNLVRYFFPLCCVLVFAASHAQAANLAADFSIASNPNGDWSYGLRLDSTGEFFLYNDTATVPVHYKTAQLAGWSSTNFPALPYVLKNISDQDWNFDGTSDNGGLGVLGHGQVLMHPYSLANLSTVARWTAPSAGEYAIDAVFSRFEQVEDRNSSYEVLLNGVALPGASGLLFDYGGPDSSAQVSVASLLLSAGDRLDFVVGFGSDDSSDTDGTIVSALITQVPEPGTMSLALLAMAGLAVAMSRARRGRLRRSGASE